MNKTIQIFRSTHFQNDVNLLTFAASNFTFKQTRSLVEMLKSDNNVSHLEKIDKIGFDKPLFTSKIQKDLRVLLTLEVRPIQPDYTLTFLRAIRLSCVQEAVETLDTEDVCAPFEFDDFW